MIKKEALEFWDNPDFKRQQELIAGPVKWENSEEHVPLQATWIETAEIRNYLAELKEPKIMELGCGVGRLLRFFKMKYSYVGLDISSSMIKKAQEYIPLKTMTPDARLGVIVNGVFPMDDTEVDFVYSFLVFQHIQTKKEIENYLSEIERVLRPGGYFRVQTLKGDPHPENMFGGFHGRFYPSMQDFKGELGACANLEVVGEDENLGHPGWLWITMRKPL